MAYGFTTYGIHSRCSNCPRVALHAGVEVVGHSAFTLTLDTYGDYIPEQDGGALNALPEPPSPVHPAAATDNVVPLRRQG